MHVKQLTTSQAFQMIPRKASVYQEDVKALQASAYLSLSQRRRRKGDEGRASGQSGALCRYLRSQDSYLHIPQVYCNTLLPTKTVQPASPQREPVVAVLTRTPTETEHYNDGRSDYSYVLSDGVL